MPSDSPQPAAIAQPTPGVLALSGCWTAGDLGSIEARLEALRLPATATADATRIAALDTAGAWLLGRG